ncbi:MAG: hypothetical protein ACRCUK_09990 [Plesiomonas shigelloides]
MDKMIEDDYNKCRNYAINGDEKISLEVTTQDKYEWLINIASEDEIFEILHLQKGVDSDKYIEGKVLELKKNLLWG